MRVCPGERKCVCVCVCVCECCDKKRSKKEIKKFSSNFVGC